MLQYPSDNTEAAKTAQLVPTNPLIRFIQAMAAQPTLALIRQMSVIAITVRPMC
jgi:hypothetical protein